MRVVLLGMPGAGKGTQARRLAGHYGVPHISTGEIFRRAADEDTPLGAEARGYMERGELVPDPVVVELVRFRLSRPDARQGFVLDGFPRTLAQAAALQALLEELEAPLDAAVHLRVSREEAIARIADRLVCEGCETMVRQESTLGGGDTPRCPRCGGRLRRRADDTRATVTNRVEVYLSQTAPLIEYYRNMGILREVDGEQPVEAVFGAIRRALEA